MSTDGFAWASAWAKKGPGRGLQMRDSWARRFAPSGVFLRALVNENAWITSGCRPEMPVYYSGSRVFLVMSPVTTAIRLAKAKDKGKQIRCLSNIKQLLFATQMYADDQENDTLPPIEDTTTTTWRVYLFDYVGGTLKVYDCLSELEDRYSEAP